MSELPAEEGLPPGGWATLWAIAREYRGRMILLGAASFVGAMLEAGFLVLLTATVLALAAGQTEVGPMLGLSIPTGSAVGLAGIAVLARYLLNVTTVRVSASLVALVRTSQRRRVARAFLSSDWGLQQTEPSGRLQELMTSFVGRINSAMLALTQAVTAALSLIAFLSAGVVVDPVSTLAVLAALGVLGLALSPIRNRIRGVARESVTTDIDFATTIAELGSLGMEMQTFGVKDHFTRRLDEVIRVNTEQQRRVQALSGMLSPTYTFFAYGAVLVAVAVLQTLGVGDLAAVGAIVLLMLRSLGYGQQLLAVSGQLAAAMPSFEMLGATVDRYLERPAHSGTAVPQSVAPIAFEAVSFSYTPDRPALQDINLSLVPGEMLGVIGPSGAGKSTFAQLLLGLQTPVEGTVTVDGIDLRQVDRSWWTRRVAFVAQDAKLFTGTVAENIRFFREGLDDDALRRAAEKANVLHDIQQLPNGMDTHLGERGGQLSGGQRQRLSIARALVADPDLLVLDEPTSALDGHSESLIRETLASLQGRVTVVIVAHRMSTLDLCDRILVIEEGRVSAIDRPELLRDSNAFYRKSLDAAGIP